MYPLLQKNASSYQDRIRKRITNRLRVVSILLPMTCGTPQWSKHMDMIDQQQLRETMTLTVLEHP